MDAIKSYEWEFIETELHKAIELRREWLGYEKDFDNPGIVLSIALERYIEFLEEKVAKGNF